MSVGEVILADQKQPKGATSKRDSLQARWAENRGSAVWIACRDVQQRGGLKVRELKQGRGFETSVVEEGGEMKVKGVEHQIFIIIIST